MHSNGYLIPDKVLEAVAGLEVGLEDVTDASVRTGGRLREVTKLRGGRWTGLTGLTG